MTDDRESLRRELVKINDAIRELVDGIVTRAYGPLTDTEIDAFFDEEEAK